MCASSSHHLSAHHSDWVSAESIAPPSRLTTSSGQRRPGRRQQHILPSRRASSGMRRRSRLEAHRGGERPLWKRYLLYAVLVSLSLALPAALTLRGTTRIRGGTATSADTSGTGRPSSGGGDDDRVRATTREEPALVGTLADTGAVSPLIWKGIAQGIPPTPRSEYDIHLVFSTDCSAYQNYQSIMLFNSAEVKHFLPCVCVSCLFVFMWVSYGYVCDYFLRSVRSSNN